MQTPGRNLEGNTSKEYFVCCLLLSDCRKKQGLYDASVYALVPLITSEPTTGFLPSLVNRKFLKFIELSESK